MLVSDQGLQNRKGDWGLAGVFLMCHRGCQHCKTSFRGGSLCFVSPAENLNFGDLNP